MCVNLIGLSELFSNKANIYAKKALEMLISLGSFKSCCWIGFSTGKAIKLQLKGEKNEGKMLKMMH